MAVVADAVKPDLAMVTDAVVAHIVTSLATEAVRRRFEDVELSPEDLAAAIDRVVSGICTRLNLGVKVKSVKRRRPIEIPDELRCQAEAREGGRCKRKRNVEDANGKRYCSTHAKALHVTPVVQTRDDSDDHAEPDDELDAEAEPEPETEPEPPAAKKLKKKPSTPAASVLRELLDGMDDDDDDDNGDDSF